jgi:hypothetical protein
MCALLIQVCQELNLERLRQGADNRFGFSDVYNIIRNQFKARTQIEDSYLGELSQRIIETGLEKQIFEDFTMNIQELESKEYRVTGRQTDARSIDGSTRTNYVRKNALRLARESAVKAFREKMGHTALYPWFR